MPARPAVRTAALLVTLGVLGASRGPAAAEKPADPAAVALAAGQNAFALALYPRLAAGGGNVLFSPYSIQTALAMTRAGARGETAAQMDRVLHLPAEGAPQAFQALVKSVTTAPAARSYGDDGKPTEAPAYTVSVANALWGQKGFPFVPAFRETLATSYGAAFEEVDFREGPAVRKRINDWVLAKTLDKIRDLIPEGLPTADTRLALVNAIHFLAQWDEPFREEGAREQPFTDDRGAQVPVRMMRRTAHFRYADDGKAQVLALPYRGHAAEMLLVLPKDPAGLAALERDLTPERVAAWAQGRGFAKVALALPRFRFEAPTDLGAHLAALGMPDAFDPAKADFRAMADVKDQPLYVGVVLHKAFIAVDEKGTEAAAATAVMMRAGSAPRPEEPIPFVCDRPFLFFVRHVATGALLFAGRLARP